MLSDEYYIRRTFSLAKKAEGGTSPNPLVGAVIVKRGRIISEGFHRRVGLAHAEAVAISKAKRGDLEGSTLFINLEPCFHWGRTPPCVDKIISSGIKRVVISVKDPNPLVSGKSIKKLREAGLEVKVGLLRKEAERLNEVFFKNMREKRPFVVVKFAQTLDGKIADREGNSFWITSYKARSFSKRLRGIYDAVLVGINTVLKDNPYLDSPSKKITKIILDPNLRISSCFNLFKRGSRVFIFVKKKTKIKKKFPPHTFIERLTYKEREGFDLDELLKRLYSFGICSLFIEGGSYTIGSFFAKALVDKVYIFVAPKIALDKEALSSVSSDRALSVENFLKIKDLKIERVGRDFLFSGYPKF